MDSLIQTFKLTSAELKKVAEAQNKVLENGEKAKRKTKEDTEEILTDWQKAQKAAEDYNKKHTGSHMEVGKLGESFTGVTVLEGTLGLTPGELFTPEQINQLGQRIAALGPGEKYAKQLDDLSRRIEKIMGPDNYIAKLLEIEIPYLRKGARSADEATALVQSVLIPFMAAFQRELANPTTPPEMRMLLIELMNLAQSGQHQLDNLLKEFEKNNRAQQGIDMTLAQIRDRQAAANAFAADIGKKVDAVDKKQDSVAKDLIGIHEYTGKINTITSRTASHVDGFAKDLVGIHEYAGKISTVTSRTASHVEGVAKDVVGVKEQLTATRSQIKEASQQAKRDAEETHKGLQKVGDELLHGSQVPVHLNDELERFIISRGG
jgi:predicted  nucleic acid-binding Zn-ribbon protein